jgi:tol-pal system protein YbgF
VRGEGKKTSAVLAVLACAALFLSFPACAGLFDDDVARQQIVEQTKRLDDVRQQQGLIAERLGKVEDALKNQPVLGLVSQIEALREELRQLRGQIEVVGNNIDVAAKRQRDMYVDLDTRLRRLEQPGAGAAPPPGGAAAPAATGSAAPAQSAAAPATADESRVYEAAQNQRRSGNYQGAIIAFQNFIAQYPRSTLAPRAQYWIGDSRFNLRDYKNAIADQHKLLSTYPDSPSVPDALLNIASSQVELGDTAGARRTMDGLVERYPASEAAEKAKRRLATLR